MKGTLVYTILQGTGEGKGVRGRPAIQWLDDVKEWTGLSLNAMWSVPEDRVAWGNCVNHAVPTD